MKEISEEFFVTLSPNPSTGIVNLAFNSDDLSQKLIRITDLTGTIVYEKELKPVVGINHQELDLKHLAGGLYFISTGTLGDRNRVLQLITEN